MCVWKAAIITWQRERGSTHAHACEHTNFPPWEHILSMVPFFGSSSLAILLGGEANSSSLKGNLLMPELLQGQVHRHTYTNQCLKAPYSQLTGHKTYTSTKALQHSWKQQPQHAFNGQGSKVISMQKWQRAKGVKQSIRHLTFPLLLLLRMAAEETEMENLHETKASLQHCII